MQLIIPESLMVPGTLGPFGQAQAARRLATLLSLDSEENRRGGTGKATQVFNCFGEALCLKSIVRVSHAGRSEHEVKRIFRARAVAFRCEYDCQRVVAGVPNMARVLAYGTYAGGPIMVMEWVQGVPIRDLRTTTRKCALLCARIGARVCATLLGAHVRDPRFAHRDISGNNILLRDGGGRLADAGAPFELCLVDFGSAVSSEVRETATSEEGPIWRNATPEYAPPEMLTHSDPGLLPLRESPKIDVYALSSVLWELYWGYTPYRLTELRPRVPHLHKISNRPHAYESCPASDEGFVEALRGGLEPVQAHRPSLEELWSALQGFCAARDGELGRQIAEERAAIEGRSRRSAPQGMTIVRR